MATANLAIPEKFTLKSESEQDWRFFHQKFELYLMAAGLNDKPNEVKVALLLTHGGDELLRIYNAIDFGASVTAGDGSRTDPSKSLDTVLAKLNEHFAPRKLVIASRYRFRCCMQKEEETLDAFITRVKTLVKDCDFSTERDDAIRDQIVFGCRDDKLREKFLREECISLLDTLKLCEARQASQKQMQMIKKDKEEKSGINKIRPREKMKNRHSKQNSTEVKQDRPTSSTAVDKKPLRSCKFCGKCHVWNRKNCAAYGNKCGKCGKMNHFAKQCFENSKSSRNSRVSAVEGCSESSDSAEYILGVKALENNCKYSDFELKEGDDPKSRVYGSENRPSLRKIKHK